MFPLFEYTSPNGTCGTLRNAVRTLLRFFC
jgi:hypothetical protein